MKRTKTNWVVKEYKCEACGATTLKKTKFCFQCGRQALPGPVVEEIPYIEWLPVDEEDDAFDCSNCGAMVTRRYNYCPLCGGIRKESGVDV